MRGETVKLQTASGKKLIVRVRPVGQSFGVVGQVVSLNGRVLWEGPTRPYGFTASAERDAIEHARGM